MHGHLVIADISGYTQFLTSSELEHANGIIGELLNAIVGAIQAPLTVSRIEGDAVFMYGAMPEGMSGQTVLESVELLYCSFAGSLETMTLNTSCQCNACVNISSLGLKIVMHCGEFAKADVGGQETLSGADVVMAHRLLKNSIHETTGIADYMIVTQQCVDDLGVAAIVAGWTEHTEEYEHVGEVKGYVSSLPDVWVFMRQQNENRVVQREAWLSLSAYSQAPPAIVWDHLVDPIKRTLWLEANANNVIGDGRGRIGPGAEYHCAHGENNEILIFTVLDMKPMDYITFLIPMGNGIGLRYTDYVIPSGTGTRIVSHCAPLFSTETGKDMPDGVLAQMAEPVGDDYTQNLARIAEMADEAAADLATA
ncbi:MAG: DUF2652 domain-containing protein [Actinomycetota bacterium]|nr:DUF2652 domain-containing protein [Actinomycetota bacterium]